MFLQYPVFFVAMVLSATSFQKSVADNKTDDDDAVTPLQNLFDSIQATLAGLHSRGGMPAVILKRSALQIAELAEDILKERGVTIPDGEVNDLITEVAKKFNNLASLTALFDDALSLEAAKLDAAFYLWDALSKIIVDEATEEHQIDVVVAAIEKTSIAIADAAEQTTNIFHFLNDNKNHLNV